MVYTMLFVRNNCTKLINVFCVICQKNKKLKNVIDTKMLNMYTHNKEKRLRKRFDSKKLQKRMMTMKNNQATFLNNLTTICDARSCRASSWNQSGRNKDYWLIELDRPYP